MESFYVEIVNPKAKNILNGLENLNLIRIKKPKTNSKFGELLNMFSIKREPSPFDETTEVEAVRNEPDPDLAQRDVIRMTYQRCSSANRKHSNYFPLVFAASLIS